MTNEKEARAKPNEDSRASLEELAQPTSRNSIDSVLSIVVTDWFDVIESSFT